MAERPPFRMPCGASIAGEKLFLGSPFAHGPAPILVDKYTNVTTVDNPLGGDPVPPYERYSIDLSGPDSCESHNCDPDVAPCGAWPKPFAANVFNGPDGSVNFAVAHKRGFKSVQARRLWNGRFGYKSVESSDGDDHVVGCGDETFVHYRGYQGTPDRTKYCSLDISATWEETDYTFPGPTSSSRTETLEVSLAIGANTGLWSASDLSISPNDDRNNALANIFRAHWTWANIVDRMANAITSVGVGGSIVRSGGSITITRHLVQDVTDPDTGIVTTYTDDRLQEQVDWDFATGSFSRTVYHYSFNMLTLVFDQYIDYEESVDVTNTVLNYSSTFNGFPSFDYQLDYTQTMDIVCELGAPNTDSDIRNDAKNNLLVTWPLDDDLLYPWRTDNKPQVAPLVSRDETNLNTFDLPWYVKDYGTPLANAGGGFNYPASGWAGHCGIVLGGDPQSASTVVAIDFLVTAGDVISGAVTGLNGPVSGYSVLGGDFPPGVTFDPVTGEYSGTVTDDGHWGVTVQITGTALITGEILGAPKLAGYQNYFNFSFEDWKGCCFDDGMGFTLFSFYVYGWGMDVGTYNASVGAGIPLNATQWTNNLESINKPFGAWEFYADPTRYHTAGCASSGEDILSGGAGALWLCKYAEILDAWNSQNFARPAGKDKFVYDEREVVEAFELTGSGPGATFTSRDWQGLAVTIDDPSGIWGGPVVGGFYEISVAGSTVTLGTKIFDVPSDWASASGDDDVCFGKLRFSNYPSILGRVAVTPDMAGTTFTLATAQPNFGMLSATYQELINLYDADMNTIAGPVAAVRVDDSHFTTGATYPTAKYIQVSGAAAYYVNDNDPKGDYAMLQTLWDFRTNQEYARLTGKLDCGGSQVSQPTQNNGYANFSQTPACLAFSPCAPKVVCITPNGESFPNGFTQEDFFQEDFVCDEHYGSKKLLFVQATMTDLLWQTPHVPLGLIDPETADTVRWSMDDGTCQEDSEEFTDGGATIFVRFYRHAPQVETLLSVPCKYGGASPQVECPPDLPAGIQIGWLSPVDNVGDGVALPPDGPSFTSEGKPNGIDSASALHQRMCDAPDDCRFDYTVPGC